MSHTSETQKQRWIKYGGNVFVMSILAIAVAVFCVYLAQKRPWRWDTRSSQFGLKPQTVYVLKNLKQKVRIISLYTKTKPISDPASDSSTVDVQQDEAVERVNDLLHQFQSHGQNSSGQDMVSVDWIDPDAERNKVNDLINEVENHYAAEIRQYRDFLDTFKTQFQLLKPLAEAEAPQAAKLPPSKLSEIFAASVRDSPQKLNGLQADVEKMLSEHIPDYRQAAAQALDAMNEENLLLQGCVTFCAQVVHAPGVPPEIKDYLTAAAPRFQQMQAIVQKVVDAGSKLGDLKLDTLRTAVRIRDPILVIGEDQWKVIPYEQMWAQSGSVADLASGRQIRPRFLGEEQLTGAVQAVSSIGPKKKVVFCRPIPISEETNYQLFTEGADRSIAQRLRENNFEVMERDLTPLSDLRAQAQEMPAPPQPTDDQIKNAIWVVMDLIKPYYDQQTNATYSMDDKVFQHLKDGGSVLVLANVGADPLVRSLHDFGLQMQTDRLVVHDQYPPASTSAAEDEMDTVLRQPGIFQITDYGHHPLVNSLQSLDLLLIDPVAVHADSMPGVDSAELLPIPTEPQAPRAWARALSDFENTPRDKYPTFDPQKDQPGPFHAAAAAEKGASRLVVIGVSGIAENIIIDHHDQEMFRRGVVVSRFPGNAELFMNSILWLAHQDQVLALGPDPDVSRIRQMSDGVLQAWRIGVLLIGLPALVIAWGVTMGIARRD